MNDNAKKWVEALRSGNYSQDIGKLHTKKGMCCLGVACDIYEKEVGGLEPYIDDGSNYYYYADNEEFLPDIVREWLGLDNGKGGWSTQFNSDNDAISEYKSLVDANDCEVSFNVIAEIIEAEPPGLFAADK